MNLIKTKSFTLASYLRGNEKASRLALVLPGRLDTKDYPHLKSHVEYLAQRGYLALSFDPPGTWESPGSIDLYTMTNYLIVINELIEYFGNRPTLALGHSRGGSMAVLAGVRNQYVTHFVSIMGNYSYAANTYKHYPDKDWQARGFKTEKRNLPNSSSGETRIFELPYAFLEDGTKFDMLDDLRKCPKPKLFIFGTRDIIAPPEIMQKAYQESAQPKEIFALDSGHDYRYNPSLINTVNEAIGQFLDKYASQ